MLFDRSATTRLLAGLILFSTCTCTSSGQPAPVDHPVPTIEKGDIVVGLRTIAQLPRLPDAPNAAFVNGAFARIQNLFPARGGSPDLFVNDLRGVIYRVHPTGNNTLAEVTPYLDLRAQDVGFTNQYHGNESGLSGFAFHPDFNTPGKPGFGKLYVAFSAPPGSGKLDYPGDGDASHQSVITEFATQDPTARTFTGTKREVLRVGQPGPTHNIGTLSFNPTVQPGDPDYGMLYVSFGDGTGQYDPRKAAQRKTVPNGKILRLNPFAGPKGERHTAPSDNPFPTEPEAAPLVWAYGLRHPQHFSWDIGGTHRLFIAEMGQDMIEEINVGVRGGNYGWSDREGTYATGMALGLRQGPVYPTPPKPATDPSPFIDPVAQYGHQDGFAIASVIVYRGKEVPALAGKILCCDIVNGRVFCGDEPDFQIGHQTPLKSLRLSFDGAERELRDVTLHSGYRVDLRLGQDANGEVYLLTKSDGKVRQLIPADRPRR